MCGFKCIQCLINFFLNINSMPGTVQDKMFSADQNGLVGETHET